MLIMSSPQGSSKGHVWQGGLMIAVLTYLAGLSINVIGVSVSFAFLPLIAICLWPRDAGTISSILVILFFGLLLDFISFGPLGLWALIYLTIFAVFRPQLRLKSYDFRQASLRWLGVLGLAIIMAFCLGWFAAQDRPAMLPLLYQGLVATVFFPCVYGIRSLLKSFFSDSEERGL